MKASGIEWLGDIPDEWGITKTKYKVIVNNGKEIETEEGDIPVYGTGGAFKTTNKYLFNGRSVLLGRKGTIDKPLYVDDKFWTVDTAFYTTMKKNMNVKLFYYLATCFDYKYYQTGSTVPSMTQTDLGNIYIPNMSFLEQQAIADFLDDKVGQIDGILSDLNKQIDILNKYKKSLITETVTKGLDPNVKMKDSGIDWIGEIPEGWCISKLKYSTKCNSNVLKENTSSNYKFRYVDISSVNYDEGICGYQEISFEEAPSRARRIVKKGDTIISTVRTYLKAIAFVNDDNNVIVSTGFAVYSPLHKVEPKYLSYYVKTETFIQQVDKFSYGIAYPAISTELLSAIPIILPTYKQQQQIADYLDKKCSEIDSAISDKQKQIEVIEKLKKSLIYEYVTGKKRVGGELRCQEISLESEKTFSSIL